MTQFNEELNAAIARRSRRTNAAFLVGGIGGLILLGGDILGGIAIGAILSFIVHSYFSGEVDRLTDIQNLRRRR